MKRFLLAAALLLGSSAASAMSLDWTGIYRIEWNQVDKPSLGDPSYRKSYGLHYLGLQPRIIVSDGVEINAKFDVLANQDSAYNNAQMGQLIGQSVPPGPGDSNIKTTSTSHYDTPVRVSHLALTVNQEYGTAIIGRAPFDFGLGMVFSAGNGPFDHWHSTMDMVAYKFNLGNISVMPILGQVSQDFPDSSNQIQDQMIQLTYDAKESNAQLGVLWGRRKAPLSANDTPVTATAAYTGDPGLVGGIGATRIDQYSMETKDFTFSRKWESFRFRMEAAFINGDFGVKAIPVDGGDAVNVNNGGYGIAVEMEFPRPESRWDWSLRLGAASGDDPKTTGTWEGFAFNRNYDVAMLLFNQRLGNPNRDFLRTNVIKDTTAHDPSTSLDDEAISNAYYFSPKVKYAFNEHFELSNTLTLAQLMVQPTLSKDVKKDLGIEWDIGLNYKPRANIRWENTLGLLQPGGAFKDGDSNLPNAFTFGFTSRAAITF